LQEVIFIRHSYRCFRIPYVHFNTKSDVKISGCHTAVYSSKNIVKIVENAEQNKD